MPTILTWRRDDGDDGVFRQHHDTRGDDDDDDEGPDEDFDEVISATTDLVSLSDELPDLSNALGERNRTYTDTSPLGVNPYRQGLIWWQTVCN